uniref:E3 ubiquitin-protein ligase TRIM41-like n=1 Tax=Petromyzon marinus TaxID=7757 RepID=A0AAJ7UG28_PETMA|nr:E3 ubiquitin-protein ligase TRIM41-like [Petromyzon marinus]
MSHQRSGKDGGGDDDDDRLVCSICLELFTTPVTLACGHTFCSACIDSTWATAVSSLAVTSSAATSPSPSSSCAGIFSCPHCRRIFPRRPELGKNVLLADMVDQLVLLKQQKSEKKRDGGKEEEDEEEERTTSSHRRCRDHSKPLEYFCRGSDDCHGLLVCAACVLVGSHKGHEVVTVEAERALRSERVSLVKRKLRDTETTARGRTSSLRHGTRLVQEAAEETKSRLGASYGDLLRLVAEDRESALRAVDAERDAKLSAIRRDIGSCAEVLAEAQEALRAVDDLEATEDHVEFIQKCMTNWDSFVSLESVQVEPALDPPLEFVDAAALQERIDGFLASFRASQSEASPGDPARHFGELGYREFIRRYGCSPTLNVDSAHPELRFSPDLRRMTLARCPQALPDAPERFDTAKQALCSEPLSSGRRYWEVDVAGCGWYRVGAAYATIARKGAGTECRLGENDESWCLLRDSKSLVAWHGGSKVPLKLAGGTPHLRRVGIYLDWEAGLLTFCGISAGGGGGGGGGGAVTLHAFHHEFTQPLLPALAVGCVTQSLRIIELGGKEDDEEEEEEEELPPCS